MNALSALAPLPLTLTEAQFERTVMDFARLRGWKCTHFRPAKNARGVYMTPLSGDAGCPDLILARDGLVLLAELKSHRGSTTPEQLAWLRAAGGHGRIWRPEHWPHIYKELS